MARSKPSRSKRKRRFAIPVMLVTMILLGVMTSAGIPAFDWLRAFCLSHTCLRGITVDGNRRISSADILDASDLHIGTDSIFSIMNNLVEERIKARFRYLEQVEVRRSFVFQRSERVGGWVTITVREREPVALAEEERRGEFSFIVIDAHGFILEENVQSPHGDMPIIVGVDVRALKSNMQDRPDVKDIPACPTLNLALDVLATARSATPGLFDQVFCIDARDPDNIILDTRYSMLDAGSQAGMPVPPTSNIQHSASSIQRPVPSKVIIRIASDRIQEGLSDVLPVIMKLRQARSASALTRHGSLYMDARFPGAIYCGEGTYSERGWESG